MHVDLLAEPSKCCAPDFNVGHKTGLAASEKSLRHIRKQRGVETTSLNAYGIQEEMHLGSILDHERCTQTFGANLVENLAAFWLSALTGIYEIASPTV